MKQILIPTDFTVASLQPVHHVVRHYSPNNRLKILLLHLLEPPTSLQDLFTRWPAPELKKGISKEFSAACEILQNKYSADIHSLEVVIKHGNTTAYLKNLIDGYKVNAVWTVESFSFTKPCKQSVDLNRLIKKSNLFVHKAPSGFTPVSAGNSLSELLMPETLEMNIA